MLERVARKQRVVRLNADAHLVLQPKLLKLAVQSRNSEVGLMSRGLLGLGFDRNLAIESDLVLVLHH